MSCWLWSIPPHNYPLCVENRVFAIRTAGKAAVQRIRPRDRIFAYVPGRKVVAGMFTAWGAPADMLFVGTRDAASDNVFYGLDPDTGLVIWDFANLPMPDPDNIVRLYGNYYTRDSAPVSPTTRWADRHRRAFNAGILEAAEGGE